MARQLDRLANQLVEVEELDGQLVALPASKILHAAHGLRCVQGTGASRLQVAACQGILILIGKNQFQKAEYAAERVVEVVCHAAGQLAESTHLLGLDQLVLSATQLFIGRAQPAKQAAIGDRRSEQIGYQIEELDLLIV